MITLYGISNCDTIKKAKKYLSDTIALTAIQAAQVEALN